MTNIASGVAVGALHVRDLDRSLGFYRDLLGLELRGEPTETEDEEIGRLVGAPRAKLATAVLALPGTAEMLELVEFETPAGEPLDPEHANPGTTHLAFYVNDMASTRDQLRREGVPSVSGPDPIEIPSGPLAGGRVMYVKDPDGIRIELIEAATDLDADPRDPGRRTGRGLVGEFSHFAIHVQEMRRSLGFYRDLLGFDLAIEWFGQEEFLRRIVGYPEADVNMAIFRLPESPAYLELIEYGNVPRVAVDPAVFNSGSGHFTLFVDDLPAAMEAVRRAGFALLTDDFVEIPDGPLKGAKAIFSIDPDGLWTQLIESENAFDGAPRRAA